MPSTDFERPKVIGNIYQRRALKNGAPKVVAHISQDEIERLKKKEENTKRYRMDLTSWFNRVEAKRPFIATQHRVAKKKAILAFEKKQGRPPTRKERQLIHQDTVVEIAQKYRGKNF